MFRHAKRMGRWLAIAVAIGLVCFSHALAKKPPAPPDDDSSAAYTIVPFLPPELQSVSSHVTDLNDVGEAIGWAEGSPDQYQSWHLDLITSVYTPLPGDAAAINNGGQIVGVTEDVPADPAIAYFLNEPGAEPIPLPPPNGVGESIATDINDEGIIVGYFRTPSPSFSLRAVAWQTGIDGDGMPFVDSPVVLPPMEGDLWSSASQINDSPGSAFQVVGDSSGAGQIEAVVWSLNLDADGRLVSPVEPVGLGTLPDASNSYGYAINESGDVCGRSGWFPFVAPVEGGIQPLPLPRDTQEGWAFDINDEGEIVGQLDIHKVTRNGTGWPEYHAWFWSNGSGVDLETLIDRKSGWDQLWGANRISNGGVIAGHGRFDVEKRGFIMIPNDPE